MRGRQLPGILLVGALVLGFAGCSSASSSSSSTTTRAGARVLGNGGTVVVAVPSLPSNFNPSTPAGANQVTAEVMAQVWPQAFVTDPEGVSTVGPGFVQTAEVQGISPFTVVYTLNPKAVWSDGVPIGVADFVYNWQEELRWAPELPDAGVAAGYEAISSIVAGDGNTVVVKFSHPYTEWQSLFANLVPAHIAERYGWAAAFQGFESGHLVSGGPYMVSSFTPGSRLVLSRNPHYWFTPGRLAHIVLQVEPSNRLLGDLMAGTVDVAEVPAGPATDDAVASSSGDGAALSETTVEQPLLWQLCFNMTDAVVSSLSFRTAIERSLDVDEITADSADLDYALALPYPSRLVLGANPVASPGANTGGGGPDLGDSTPAGDSVGIGGYDLAEAVALFSAAGYTLDAGILRSTSTGAPVRLSLTIPAGIPLAQAAADVVQAELGAVGIAVDLRPVPLSSMLQETLPTGGYQMALAPFQLSPYPETELPVYTSSVLPSSGATAPSALDQGPQDSAPGVTGSETVGEEPGAAGAGVVTRDVFGFDDPAVSSDLSQALTNLNPTTDDNLLNAANAQLWTDLPTIPLFEQPSDIVQDTRVRGVSDSPTWAGIFWDAQEWAVQLHAVPTTTSAPAGS